jgi:hypothetical protein
MASADVATAKAKVATAINLIIRFSHVQLQRPAHFCRIVGAGYAETDN